MKENVKKLCQDVNYENFYEYKKDLKIYLSNDYKSFISKYINEKDYLYTISYAYALYAKKEPNIFYSLFIQKTFLLR